MSELTKLTLKAALDGLKSALAVATGVPSTCSTTPSTPMLSAASTDTRVLPATVAPESGVVFQRYCAPVASVRRLADRSGASFGCAVWAKEA